MGTIRIKCDLPGHEDDWIEGSDQITRKRRREWMEEPDDFKSEPMALAFISAWNLKNLDGTPAPMPSAERPFDSMHEQTVKWVFKAVSLLCFQAGQLPLPKSSA